MKFLNSKTDAEIVEDVRRMKGVLVLPSSADHVPDIVYRCWESGVPILASEMSGYRDLIDQSARCSVLLPEQPQLMAEQIEGLLRAGLLQIYPRSDFAEWKKSWVDLNRQLADWRKTDHFNATDSETEKANESELDIPDITVCLVHFERPEKLDQALASLESQTFENFTVHVIDDGSQCKATLDYLERLEPRLQKCGWKLFRQKNAYLGAARNTGAGKANSKYLMFMDDDNIAKTEELENLFKIAEYTSSDILTCFADVFVGQNLPADGKAAMRRIYCGANLAGGLWSNLFGDSNSLVRRSAFEALGGFHEEFGAGQEDQEFFVRAVLAGYRLMVVPEALYWYRISDVRLRNNHFSMDRGGQKVFEAYLDNAPDHMRDLIRQGHGLGYRRPQAKMTHILEKNPGMTGMAFRVYEVQKRCFAVVVKFQHNLIELEHVLFDRAVRFQAACVTAVISMVRKLFS